MTLSTYCTSRECIVSVRDNGPGIPPEHLSRLFEPFFTTKPVGRGTGLGLAVSLSLIQNQGGRIEVDSQVGRGTTVSLVLPKSLESSPSCCPPPGRQSTARRHLAGPASANRLAAPRS